MVRRFAAVALVLLTLQACTQTQLSQAQDILALAERQELATASSPSPSPTPIHSATPSPTATPSLDPRREFIRDCSGGDVSKQAWCNCIYDTTVQRLGGVGEFIKLDKALGEKAPLTAQQSDALAAGAVCPPPVAAPMPAPMSAEPHPLPPVSAMPAGVVPLAFGSGAFGKLEGAAIVAQDGQFLGYMTSNQFDLKSIVNEFGNYGNEFSQTSIFNTFSNYGSEFSMYSPFNQFATKPPLIVIGGEPLGYLTTNEFKTPRLDPYILVGIVKSLRR